MFIVQNLSAQLQTNAPWPMFQQNLQHTGQTNDSVLGPQKNPAFYYSWPGYQAMIPIGWPDDYCRVVIGGDNTVYWCLQRYIRAYTNGSQKWSHYAGQYINNSLSIGGDGTIYIGYNSELTALDPDNGTPIWSCNIGGATYSAPAIGVDNTIYIGCDDYKLYAITNGAVKWTNKMGGQVRSSPAIGSDGTIYVGCNDDKVYAVTNGVIRWTNRLGGNIFSSPAIDTNNVIYIGCDDDKLYAITNGVIKWSNRTGGDIKASPAIGEDGTVYITSFDSMIYAFNPDGTLKWTNRVGDSIYTSPVIGSDNTVYVASRDGFVSTFTNGVLRWKMDLSGEIRYSTPAIDDRGILYVSTRNTFLYAIIGNEEPQLVWSSNTGYSNDGVQPNDGTNGQYFRFEVKYIDIDNHYPLTNQVWIDLDDNGTYEMDERFTLYSNSGTTYSNGIIYTNIIQAYWAGDGIISYRFHFTDMYGCSPLSCDPITDHYFTVTNTNISHRLEVTINTDINGICDSYTNNTVMAVRIWDSKTNHYLTGFQVGNASNMIRNTDYSNVCLWYDQNENCDWDQQDIFVAKLIWDGTELWTNNSINFPTNLSFPQNFVVTIDVFPDATVSNAFRAFIPAGGVRCSYNGVSPQDTVTNSGNMIIGPYLNVNTNDTISGVTSSRSRLIMSLRISGSLESTLSSFKLGNTGTMVQGSDITNILLYHDKNSSHSLNGGDAYITNLFWNGNGFWTNDYITYTNNIAPYMDIIVIAEFNYTVTESNTFKPYIPVNGVKITSGKYAPAIGVTNQGEVSMYQFIGPYDFDIALGASAHVMGDLNNDGYLDIVIAGYSGGRYMIEYINNKDGTFTRNNLAGGLDQCALALGDIDNDGDLDMISAGVGATLTKYVNDGSGGLTIGTFTGAIAVNSPCITLGDIDNDGDLDLVVSGSYRLDRYINDGTGNFTNTDKDFGTGVTLSSHALGDIDNDGDLDLIVTGNDSSVYRLDKYINDGSSTNFAGPYPFGTAIYNGSISLGDINSDGYLDLIVTGNRVGSGSLITYLNDKTGSFTAAGSIAGFEDSAVSLGDIDNDGDLDLFASGWISTSARTYGYLNNGSGTFGYKYSLNGVGDYYRGCNSLGDIDNDNDLDLIISGYYSGGAARFQRYYNTERTVNSSPSTPAVLTNTNINGYWCLEWSASSDDKTDTDILRYKIAFGTNVSGDYHFSTTNIDYPRGQANLGNVCIVTGERYQTKISIWKPVFWKVCAIDSSFIRSDYSEEKKTFVSRVHNITKSLHYCNINRALTEADKGDIIQADPYVFPEQVNVNNYTNLVLESTEWANNSYMTNTFIYPSDIPAYALRLYNSKNCRIQGFTIKNSTNAVLIDDGEMNNVNNNILISNYGYGVQINNSSTFNMIQSNIITLNENGVYLNNCSFSTLFRNAVYHNQEYGIYFNNADQNVILNNSLASNGITATYDSIRFSSDSDDNIIKNNIVAFSRTGYGINVDSGCDNNQLTYNNIFGNSSGDYNNIVPGTGTITNDPLWNNYDIFSTNFLYLSNRSPCIDAGDPSDPAPSEGNNIMDMGWKEFTHPYLTIDLSKSITNVTLNMIEGPAMPGATIEYMIHCTINSYGGMNAQNLIIYDKVDYNTVYATNDSNTTGWSLEFSTNDLPDQSFNSSDYTNERPNKSKIQWIRWKNEDTGGGEKQFYYKTIIK